jgi:hypothetical protein
VDHHVPRTHDLLHLRPARLFHPRAQERGEGLPLTDVVLGMQKSSLAFEATLQIRNKVLKAYEDILNMPV